VASRDGSPRRLCLGGSLFYNSCFNARAKTCGLLDEVFVPINPGNAGLPLGRPSMPAEALGALLPHQGPSYSAEEIKATLDNCKLSYSWMSESDVIGMAVDALSAVGSWRGSTDHGMGTASARREVDPGESPGAVRSREPQPLPEAPRRVRGYALSGPAEAVPRGTSRARIGRPSWNATTPRRTPSDGDMSCRPPGPACGSRPRALRRQTGSSRCCGPLSRQLGVPFVVNTSFNGFAEPIVCSPRDAIRVFFGTGVDLLVLGRFVLSK